MTTIDEALELCVLAGALLLGSNAEIDRTESTIAKMAKAVGMKEAEVFATPTGFVVTLEDQNGNSKTQVRRITNTGNNLSVLDEVNGVSRSLAQGKVSATEARALLRAVSDKKPSHRGWIALNVGIASGSITYLLGGGLSDLGIVCLISMTAYLISAGLERVGRYRILSIATGAVWITAWVLISSQFIEGLSIETDIVGALMFYVPGITITNGIRDITSGNLISGAARLLDALLVALTLAFGVGLVLSLGTKVAIF
ncbi:MAG: threonine/serine exporter family protein [Limnochordia bacterium]|nr:threonine/serine exporter family protein [Limnochordia bacterium]